MVTLTINLSKDRWQKLQEVAAHFNVAPEELARVSLEELLAEPNDAFRQAVEHVLHKNAELYQRLA